MRRVFMSVSAIACHIASASADVIPTVIPIISGQAGQAPLVMTVDGNTAHWSSPITGNMFVLQSGVTYKTAAYARWRVLWTDPAGTALLRLVVCDYGPSNCQPIAYLRNSTPGSSNIANDAADFSASFNTTIAAVNAGTSKQIGWQIYGDNSTPVTFYKINYELGFDSP